LGEHAVTNGVEPNEIVAPKVPGAAIEEWLALLRRNDVWQGAALLTLSGAMIMGAAWLYFEFFGAVALAR
jgi:hypothetical protein